MKITKNCYCPACGDLSLFQEKGRCLFFDIETDGLSPRFHQVYLIGVTWCEEGSWHFLQWFADTRESERQILQAFSLFLMDFDTLIHFNGATFDLPFLKARLAFHQLSDPFPLLEDIDLYRLCRPLKKLLSLENLKLKTLERFLGIDREDRFGGGELISVYEAYLLSPSPQRERDLSLHNEEDVKGMPELLPILSYLELSHTTFTLCDSRIHHLASQTDSHQAPPCNEPESAPLSVILTFSHPIQLPRPLLLKDGDVVLRAEKGRLTLQLPALRTTLRHYFPRPGDYYYLPLEDCILPKSLAAFVDPAFRQKATPDQCFASREGIFLPQKKALVAPLFQRERRGRELYFSWTEDFSLEESAATALVRSYFPG